jgi:hypothetical protein
MKLLTFESFLQERRKSEKLGVHQGLKEDEFGHRVALDFFKGRDLDDYAVTMTHIPKVGVNPQSHYDTPLGIYFYPAKYYYQIIAIDQSRLPFQHDAKYINILKINSSKRLNINTISGIDVAKNIGKLRDFYPEHDSFIETDWKTADLDANLPDIEGGKFWYVLYRLSKRIARTKSSKGKSSVIWNSILRKLGYDVVIDTGAGIIHENEETQGFFVKADSSVVTMVKRIENISDVELTQKNINRIFHDPKVSDSEKVQLFYDKIADSPVKFFSNIFRLVSLKHLSNDILKFLIHNASGQDVDSIFINKKHEFPEEIQLLGVTKRANVIRYIENPSEQVQLAAVKNEP